jgi:hypothetical protein
MPSGGITIKGATQTAKKLHLFANILVGDLERAGNEVLKEMEDNVPEYPPPIPSSQYVRTYKLQDALHGENQSMSLNEVEPVQGGVLAHLGAGEYGPYVVGIGTQAGVHMGRWWTLNEVLMRASSGAIEIVRKYARSSMVRAGFV